MTEDGRALAVVDTELLPALAGDPDSMVAEAQRAAKALMGVVKAGHLSRKIGQSEHLQFEAWQTVGHFYGTTAKVEWCLPLVEIEGAGFRARAVAIRHGVEIGAAESMCTRDEPSWTNKPAFQLASMAQTRAMAKALRSVLAFVVVLAGYEATPAEEMHDDRRGEPPPDVKAVSDCDHGARVFQAGATNGKPWRGWFCPKREAGCKPVWVAAKTKVTDVAEEVRRERVPEDIPCE